MDVLAAIRKDLVKAKAFRGLRIGMALHVEAKTGVLALTLKEAGAQVRLASCNPLSTDDAVVAALRDADLDTYAKKWETNEEYDESLHKVLDLGPNLVVDDGADLIYRLHVKRRELLPGVIGANEETTTGIVRVRAMEAEGKLAFPVIDVNDAQMKHLFDNRYGTGQSAIDGIMTATNLLLAGKRFVVAGHGCPRRRHGGRSGEGDRGEARRLRGHADGGRRQGGGPHSHRHGRPGRDHGRASEDREGWMHPRER